MRTGWIAAAAAFGLAACGGDGGKSDAPAADGGPAATTDAATAGGGAIRIVGSSSVYPFTTLVAEQFKNRFGQFPTPIVESTGTGGGIKLFCEGGPSSPDIANASRRIKPAELEQCRANGVTNVVEVQVGLDGIALAHARGAPDFKVSERDLYAALAEKPFGKAQTARTWRDVNPALPADAIEVLGPPPTSGTRDAFAELVLEKGCDTDAATKALKATDETAHKTVCTKVREDGPYVEAGENDNLIVQKLAANPKAVGVFAYSYLEENLDKLKPVPLQGVTPTYKAIATGVYPASRPLFIYVNGARASKPGLREFVRAYASDTAWGPQGYLAKRGLIASPDEVRAANAQVAQNLTPLGATGQ